MGLGEGQFRRDAKKTEVMNVDILSDKVHYSTMQKHNWIQDCVH